MSPGWQSKALQIASRVDNRTAFAFPFFNIERLAMVIPTLSASLVTLIFLFASITSMFVIMGIFFRRLDRFRILYPLHFAKGFELKQRQ